jgi:hypothetical protein
MSFYDGDDTRDGHCNSSTESAGAGAGAGAGGESLPRSQSASVPAPAPDCDARRELKHRPAGGKVDPSLCPKTAINDCRFIVKKAPDVVQVDTHKSKCVDERRTGVQNKHHQVSEETYQFLSDLAEDTYATFLSDIIGK